MPRITRIVNGNGDNGANIVTATATAKYCYGNDYGKDIEIGKNIAKPQAVNA